VKVIGRLLLMSKWISDVKGNVKGKVIPVQAVEALRVARG
jgi:hypothetical protein